MVGVSRSDAAATNVSSANVCMETCVHILATLSQPSAIVCRQRQNGAVRMLSTTARTAGLYNERPTPRSGSYRPPLSAKRGL